MAGVSDRGVVRSHNEDAIAWMEGCGVALLADGMGGHNAGEVASAMAVDTIGAALQRVWPELASVDGAACAAELRSAVAEANRRIVAHAGADPACRGMGTTVETLLLRNEEALIAHVGDSRSYRWRDGELLRLTRDHSWLQELIDSGMVAADDPAPPVGRNRITRALGMEGAVGCDIERVDAAPGDLFLLCSDGLTDLLSERRLATLLTEARGPLQAVAESLVAEANWLGGDDNVSVVLAQLAHRSG